nr:hypothetical protein [uncultured Bacteroides sp.]
MKDKLDQIISKLENYSPIYEDEDYTFLVDNLPRTQANAFFIFAFCINWQLLYNSNIKMTIYDILIANDAKKENTKKKHFEESFTSIKKFFESGFTTSEELISSKTRILDRLTKGLNVLNINKSFKNKGIHEFFNIFFNKLGNVDYETEDFQGIYLCKDSQKFRFHTDLYNKFIPAVDIAILFNREYKPLLEEFGIKINNFFALHIFLRHTVPFKLYCNYLPNELFRNQKIKNGLNQSVHVTAFASSEGVKIISDDGLFFLPNFSTNQSDYTDNPVLPTKEKIAKAFYKKLFPLVQILKLYFNPCFKRSISYHSKDFLGFKTVGYEYKTNGLIEIQSFYPLNSEWQKRNGISNIDIDNIIYKSGNHE